jgi:hypothetical protein
MANELLKFRSGSANPGRFGLVKTLDPERSALNRPFLAGRPIRIVRTTRNGMFAGRAHTAANIANSSP